MPIAIEVSHITKHFNLARNAGSLKTAALDILRRNPRRIFTALNDVSFNVAKGETLGLIGANGAGKSTLLSIIARTMMPSSGTVHSAGIISSLLELGAGFHPDLTGRENVFLYGSIMGISRETMRQRYDEIVAFSGLADFMDQPVRHYSSGMYVRLGFAVAVQVDPDILLIDEVLAVGDADFQARCISKMKDFRQRGKSMLIISHDMHTICSIADRIAYLDHGMLKSIGNPLETVASYGADAISSTGSAIRREWGTGEARIVETTLLDAQDNPITLPPPATPLRLRVAFEINTDIPLPTLGFSIIDASNNTVFGSNTQIEQFSVSVEGNRGVILLELDATTLRSGDYLLSFALHSSDNRTNYHRLDNHLSLHLANTFPYDGICRLPTRFTQLPG